MRVDDRFGRGDLALIGWPSHLDCHPDAFSGDREQQRLAALRSYEVLSTAADPALDELTALAAEICRTPVALIALVDGDRQWFKSRIGLDLSCSSRHGSFCAAVVTITNTLVVPDAAADARFSENPFVTGRPRWRAFAGSPLLTPDGLALGTLCVADTVARSFSHAQLRHLETLARQVMGRLELRRVATRMAAEVGARSEADAALTSNQTALRQSEARWRALFEASPVAIALADDTGTFVAVNEAVCDLLGRSEPDIVGHHLAELIDPEGPHSRGSTGEALAAAPDGVVQIEKRFVRPDGQVRWGRITLTLMPGPRRSKWTLIQMLDVTSSKADEAALRDSEANLCAVADVVKDIQHGTDFRPTIVEACRRLASASNVSLMEPADDGTALRVSASTNPLFSEAQVPITATSATLDCYRTGVANFLPDAANHPLVSPALLALSGATSLYIVPVLAGPSVVGVLTVDWADYVPDLDDRRVNFVTLLADHAGVALRQAALIAELESIALTDQLTGLPNRRGWDHLLELHMALARRADQPLTVAIVDIDHFKGYNDTHGHMTGDQLLRDFATAGANAVRKGDSLSRWGGEEFAIVLPDCDQLQAPSVLDRVRQAVPDGQTCSIGFATWDQVETPEELVTRADQAMYRAKSAGRNQTVGF